MKNIKTGNADMNRFLSIASMVLFVNSMLPAQVSANDHLIPEVGVFNILDFQYKYYSKVRDILFDGLNDRPLVRYIRMPSFTAENILDIYEEDDNRYRIIYHEAKKSVWYNDNKNVQIVKFSKVISEKEVNTIKALYKVAIDNVRYPQDDIIGFDGMTYIFGYQAYGLRTGQTWSPVIGTMLGDLVEISDQIIKNVKNSKMEAIITRKLHDKINSLTEQFTLQE